MKTFVLVITTACVLVSGQAVAGCAVATRLNASQLNATLPGKTACVADGAGGWRWQEFHAAGGALIDWKRGSDPMDPTETVGSWSVTANPAGNNATVTHNYGSGGSYIYFVHNDGGGSYSFCTGPADAGIDATLKGGQGACP